MKKMIVMLAVLFIATPCFATNNKVVQNVTNVESRENNAWDWGVSGDVVLYETKNSEWGVRATHLMESGETRGYVTGKVYFNRATYQKK